MISLHSLETHNVTKDQMAEMVKFHQRTAEDARILEQVNKIKKENEVTKLQQENKVKKKKKKKKTDVVASASTSNWTFADEEPVAEESAAEE